MKNGWRIIPLQSLCNDLKQDIVDGPFGSELQRKDYITEGVPVLKIQNIKPFSIELKKMDYVSPAKFQELKRHSYQHGDIVMTKLGSPLGVSAIVEDLDEGVIVADLVRIRAQHINTKYLCYHLNSQRTSDFINSMQKGTTRPRVRLSVVRELPIALPSPVEQQRIVAILDEAFAGIATAIANAKKNLNNARELFESYLQSVFENKGEDWEEKTLGEIAEIKGGKRVPKGYKLEFEKTNHPYIRVADFNDYGSIDLNNIRYVNDKVFKEIKNYTISKDDLYISIAGTIGRTGIVPDELDGANLTENACKLVFKECIDKKFVYYFTKTKSFEIQAGLNTRTAAMPKLALIRLATIKFSIPKSVKIQNTFVQKFEALSKETKKLESIYQQKLVALGELKKSLLDQAFSGEL